MAKTFTWIEPDNDENTLASLGLTDTKGKKGHGMPSSRFTEEAIPGQAGARLRQVKREVSTFDLPALLEGTSESDFDAKRLALPYIFDPLRGDGILRATYDDASERELRCRLEEGLEGNDDAAGRLWELLVLSFRAQDPYWYDTATVTRTYAIADAGAFFPATFPFMLASSTVFASANEDNSGDVETWPVWIITGPGSNLVLRNLTTGKTLTLNTIINEGETVTIDTTPGIKTVTHSDGSNLYGSLTSGSALWPLQKGAQSLQLELGSATTDSGIQLSYRRRYLGA